MDVEKQGGLSIKVETSIPRVLHRYPVYKTMTAKENLVASSYKETSSAALGLQASSLATNPWYLKES